MHMKSDNSNPAEVTHLLLDFKRMHLNPFSLHFSGPVKHFEARYQREYLEKSLTHIRIAPPPISYSYYAGLILIFIFGYTFVRVRFLWACLGSWMVVFLYKENVRKANQNLENRVQERTNQLELEIKTRKHAQALLQESKNKYRQLFDNVPAGIFEIDFITHKFTHVNHILCEYMGYTKKEFLSLNLFDLVTKDNKTTLKNKLESVAAENKRSDTIDINLLKKNGSGQTNCRKNGP